MKCPDCGLINHESAIRCDCGYNFSPGIKIETSKESSKKPGNEENIIETGIKENVKPITRKKNYISQTIGWILIVMSYFQYRGEFIY